MKRVRRRSLTGLIGSSHRHPLCAVPTASGGSSPAHYTEAKTRCAISAVYDAAAAAAVGSRSVYAAADSVLSTKYDAPTCLRVAADNFFLFSVYLSFVVPVLVPFVRPSDVSHSLTLLYVYNLSTTRRSFYLTLRLSIQSFSQSYSHKLALSYLPISLCAPLYTSLKQPDQPTHTYARAGHDLVV